MFRAALIATLALAGCGRSQGVSDEELGNLVIAPTQGSEPIQVAPVAPVAPEAPEAPVAPVEPLAPVAPVARPP